MRQWFINFKKGLSCDLPKDAFLIQVEENRLAHAGSHEDLMQVSETYRAMVLCQEPKLQEEGQEVERIA